MSGLKVTDVFVPGGLPKYTYVARQGRGLENHLELAKDNLCKIATVTGATKSGKTVLVRTVFQKEKSVWVDGGAVSSLEDFLDTAADQLNALEAEEITTATETTTGIAAELSGEAGFLFAKAQARVEPSIERARSTSRSSRMRKSVKAQVLQTITNSKRPVVIDDFHYIERDLQGTITRLLKPLVFDGVPVIYLAIPHRSYDAVKVEREMNGRIEQIPVPTWEPDELAEIAQAGFPLLNIRPE